MTTNEVSLKKAKEDKLFYFVANALVYREKDGRCLLLKRSWSEKVHPGKYATPGGKMEWSDFNLQKPSRINGEVLDFLDSVEGLLKRETKEEAGIELEDTFHFINSMTYIRPDGIPVVMVKLAGLYKKGDVVLEEGSFSDYAWVNVEEVHQLECVDGICDEVEKAISLFSQ